MSQPKIKHRIKHPASWKHGLRRIDPGVYCDPTGAIHFDPAELLASKGYAVTPQNEAMLKAAAEQLAREIDAGFEVRDDDGDGE